MENQKETAVDIGVMYLPDSSREGRESTKEGNDDVPATCVLLPCRRCHQDVQARRKMGMAGTHGL